MANFVNFETDIEGDDEEIGEEDDEVSNIFDVDSENSFIVNQEFKTDVLKDSYNEALEDIDKFDEISNLCEGSEEEVEIDDFKNFEVDSKKFNESLFRRVIVDHEKVHNQFCNAICAIKKNLEKLLIKVLLKNLILKNFNLLLNCKNVIICN